MLFFSHMIKLAAFALFFYAALPAGACRQVRMCGFKRTAPVEMYASTEVKIWKVADGRLCYSVKSYRKKIDNALKLASDELLLRQESFPSSPGLSFAPAHCFWDFDVAVTVGRPCFPACEAEDSANRFLENAVRRPEGLFFPGSAGSG